MQPYSSGSDINHMNCMLITLISRVLRTRIYWPWKKANYGFVETFYSFPSFVGKELRTLVDFIASYFT